MAEPRILEGTWEEISSHAGELAASGKRLRLIIPVDKPQPGPGLNTSPGTRAYFGMFKGPREATEEDFKEAEFHGDPDDGLDWTE